MTTANSVARSLRSLLADLLDRDLVAFVNPISIEGGLVTWRSPTPLEKFVDFVEYPTIRTYRRWGEAGEYSALLPDGALLQMRYRVSNGEIVAHRLAYVPCPYRIDEELLATEPLSDVLDIHASESHEAIAMQTAIRFDFDPGSAAEGHPSSHLTLNVASCRIACESSMGPGAFIQFVYRNFYRERWSEHVEFFRALPRNAGRSTVTDMERGEPHLAWRDIG